MIVPISYLFSRNKKIGSLLISWSTSFLWKNNIGNIPKSWKNTPSHIAILVNNKWVIESTLSSGMRLISFDKWKSINEVVAEIPAESQSMELIKNIYRPLKDKKYDYLGIMYFGWRIILNISFKIKIPLHNEWGDDEKYFCSEAVGRLTGNNYEMSAPVQIMEKLREQT